MIVFPLWRNNLIIDTIIGTMTFLRRRFQTDTDLNNIFLEHFTIDAPFMCLQKAKSYIQAYSTIYLRKIFGT